VKFCTVAKSNEGQKKVVNAFLFLFFKLPNTRADPSLGGIIKNYLTKIQGKVDAI
jgi:hypothetical protein